MRKNGNETNVCQICGRSGSEVELTNAGILRPAIASIIKASYPSWSSDGYICSEDIDRFRYDYVSSLIMEEKGEVTQLEQDVLDSVAKH